MPKFSFKFCYPAMEDTVTDFFFMPSTLRILASTFVAVIWCRALFQCFTNINSFNCSMVLWDGNCDDAIQKRGKLRHMMQQFAHVTQLVNGRARVPQSLVLQPLCTAASPVSKGKWNISIHHPWLLFREERFMVPEGTWALESETLGRRLNFATPCLPDHERQRIELLQTPASSLFTKWRYYIPIVSVTNIMSNT